MTAPSEVVGEEPISRAFYDVAQLLESAQDCDARVIRVLERLRALVPYERCAVLEVSPRQTPRLVTLPGIAPSEREGLLVQASALFSRLSEQQGEPAEPTKPATHLAVPLVGLDEVVGVLLVDSSTNVYNEWHVRRLSVIAAKLAAYFSMFRAIEHEAERARQLDEARQAAESANRAKDEFLALVSHELRTPLNTILVWLEALRSKQTHEADRIRALDAIGRSVRAETRLIEDLLDLSCIAKATLRLDLRAIEPAKLIRSAVEAQLPTAELKSIRVQAVLDETAAPLLADPQRFSQIIANLVANAIKFTPNGGSVEVLLERVGVLARISVIDSGSGITGEDLPTLFEPFSQADSSITRRHGGLGAGLALVKDLVELHGGRVKAESAGASKGATFTVEFPLAPTMALLQPDADAQLPLAGIRVLLVDDDKDICEVLQFVLEGKGALVSTAESAATALASIEQSMPNVLLSDIAMPGQTGYDLMRAIVAGRGAGALPSAALSAYAPGQDLPDALACGFSVLLAKPVDAEALIATVAQLAKGGAAPEGRQTKGAGQA